MRRFTIVLAGPDAGHVEVTATDTDAILDVVARMGYDEAAIFEGYVYRFSIGVDANGGTFIFQREDPVPIRSVRPAEPGGSGEQSD